MRRWARPYERTVCGKRPLPPLAKRVPRICPETLARLERRRERIEKAIDLGRADYDAEIAIDREISDAQRAVTWWEKRRKPCPS